jgi:YggT family protein
VIIISSLIYYMLEAYLYTLLAYIILGYFPQARQSKIYHFFRGICDPVLEKFRFFSVGMISFAPIVVFMLIQLIQNLLISTFGIIA